MTTTGIWQFCLLFFAALLGGALNSVAGGGSFISFPALIFTGVLPIPANATSTVALWPGSIASMGAYRKELVEQYRLHRAFLLVLSGTSLIGGEIGAQLLLHTPPATFVILIPYLLLLATLLFTFSGNITHWLRTRRAPASPEPEVAAPKTPWLRLTGISLLQFIIATYGGYFGGGIGILMLATLGLMGMENIHEMNALKTLLTSFINGVAVVTFALRGTVVWPQAILMVVAAIIGGYAGAYYARKIDQRWVRFFVILVGFSMTLYFFVRTYYP
ncbi:MAG: sulfite exporter TauE/SafE family protein [Ktedonobacteraceae bacterium]